MFRRNVTVLRADTLSVSALPKTHLFASAGSPDTPSARQRHCTAGPGAPSASHRTLRYSAELVQTRP
jgi:hypothetical protein